MATTPAKRACSVCGTLLADDGAMCPVCALRGALEQGQETVDLELDLTPSPTALRFDHYQVLTREDGTPFELGRGAMGVTYKAIDINLRTASINSFFVQKPISNVR